MSIENWKSVCDIGALVALFLAFAFGMGVWFTGNKVNEKQAVQLRQFAQDLRDKDVKIADAQRDAGAANKEAATLRKQAEDEAMQRAQIEEAIAWRRLTNLQQEEIAARMSHFPGQTASLWFSAGDREGATFAVDIASALYKAKWHVFGPSSFMDFAISGTTFSGNTHGGSTGVVVGGPATEDGRKMADALIRELTQRGFDASSAEESTRNKDSGQTITVEVVARPTGPQGEAKLRLAKTKKP